ncbi:hypothetical protein ACJX0J_010771 [Zea mays]
MWLQHKVIVAFLLLLDVFAGNKALLCFENSIHYLLFGLRLSYGLLDTAGASVIIEPISRMTLNDVPANDKRCIQTDSHTFLDLATTFFMVNAILIQEKEDEGKIYPYRLMQQVGHRSIELHGPHRKGMCSVIAHIALLRGFTSSKASIMLKTPDRNPQRPIPHIQSQNRRVKNLETSPMGQLGYLLY